MGSRIRCATWLCRRTSSRRPSRFSTMVRSLGQTPSNLELKTLLKEHCLDENVTMDRVKDMMDSIYQYTAKRDKQKLTDSFKVFDPEGTGFIAYDLFEKEILRKI